MVRWFVMVCALLLISDAGLAARAFAAAPALALLPGALSFVMLAALGSRAWPRKPIAREEPEEPVRIFGCDDSSGVVVMRGNNLLAEFDADPDGSEWQKAEAFVRFIARQEPEAAPAGAP